jgi:hypothetical protein
MSKKSKKRRASIREPEPAMSNSEHTGLCDFCGSPELDGAKTYACEPFTQTAGDTQVHYVEGWDACVECARLIDRDDWDALFQRTQVAQGALPRWEFLPDGAKHAARDAVRKLHAEFRRRRLKTN